MSVRPKAVLGFRMLYHATTLDQVSSIMLNGVDPWYQKPGRRLDFGPGFYMTSQSAQAIDFALTKQLIRDGSTAAVLEYQLAYDFWAGLNGMEFPLRGEATWKKYVIGFRTGDLKSAADGLDYVYGPVADNLRLMRVAGEFKYRFTR